MTMRNTLAALAAAALAGPVAAESTPTPVPPPASPAPSVAPGESDLSDRLAELAAARRDVVEAERELRRANSAVARGEHRNVSAAKREQLSLEQVQAQEAFDTARRRLPQLVSEAHAAGLSTSALRNYEHSLYGN